MEKESNNPENNINKVREILIDPMIAGIGDLNDTAFWEEYEEVLGRLKSEGPDSRGADLAFEGFLKKKYPTLYTEDEHQTFQNSLKSLVAEDPAEYITNRLFRYSFYDLYHINQPEQKNIIINESKRIQKILFDIYKSQKNLLELNSREFEEAIAELLFKQGYKVELTQQTKDNGYDILALLDVKGQLPMKYLVECKRYTKEKIGVEIIRSFKEVMATEKANRGIIVTTSYFTAGALDKQREIPYLLDYRDKDKVIEWVNSYFKSP
jgi:hypothetical protein